MIPDDPPPVSREPGAPDSLATQAWASDPDPKASAPGSALLGFFVGLSCGVAALALFFSGAKPRTRLGIIYGVSVQFAILIVVVALFRDRLGLR